ncbi:MAG: DNA-deoxyinosine glycosylase [Spirochaetaceae bacterium]|nr:DNA-deoxyinosine glycosylase [Spirochaetaceae bacterium]
MINCFDPILGELPHTLVLGSFPSVISLDRIQYYGNPRNAFWPILKDVFGGQDYLNYKDNVEFAKIHKIAIWDVISSCERKGSLDSAIKNVIVNEIEDLLINYPSIKNVLFNGKAAESFYNKYVKYYPYRTEFFTLPSTSPAYTLSYEKKLIEWEYKLLN